MRIVVYGKTGCTFCEQALALAESKGIDKTYKVVGSDITKEQLEEMCGKPIRTVPQIFITEGGFYEYIGGFTELKERLG